MTKKRRALLKYIRAVMNEMELRDWTIHVMHDPLPADSGNLASINRTYGQKRAAISLCAGWDNLDADIRRSTIIHELLHCHWAGADSTIEEDLPNLLGMPTFNAFFEGYRRHMEYAIDAMAEAFSRYIPLPPD